MKLFFLITLSIFSLSVFSQQDIPQQDVIITINPFGKNLYPSKSEYKYGKALKFKINNVNTFKLKGSLKNKGKNLVFEIPKIFKNEIDEDQEADIVNPQGSLDFSTDAIQLKAAFNSLEKLNTQIKGKRIKNKNELLKEVKNLKENIEFLIKRIASKEDFQENNKIFLNSLNEINNYFSLENHLKSQIEKDSIFIKDISFVKMRARNIYNSIYTGSEDVSHSINNLLTSYNKMKFNYDVINKTLGKEEETLTGQLKSKKDKIVLNIEKASVSIKRKELFAKTMSFATKIYDSISKNSTQKLIFKKSLDGINFYHELINEDFVAHTDAQQLLDDTEIFTPELKNSKGKVVHSFDSISIKVNQKWKVNFSSGYLISFIGDDNYSLKKTATETIGVIAANKSNISHTLGGLVHAYPILWDGFQPAISTGLSINSDGNLGVFGGFSLMFTEKNRLVLTMGISYTNVNVLNRSNLDATTLEFISNDKEISYDNVYKSAFFVGITYNLSE